MTITATFNDFEEMQAFAERLLGAPTKAPLTDGQNKPETVSAMPKAPAAPVAPVTSPMPTAPTATAAPVAPTVTAAPTVPSAAPVVPTVAPTYTLDDLAKAAMTLMDAGRQNDLVALLNKFGVSSMPDLRSEHYGAFATELRGLGAQI